MNDEMSFLVLEGQHTSEKTTIIAEKQKKFTFKVLRSATKPQIKHAVESMFDVKVKDVAVLNIKGKTKRFKNTVGKRSDWKKAIVTLRPEHDIDFTVNE